MKNLIKVLIVLFAFFSSCAFAQTVQPCGLTGTLCGAPCNYTLCKPMSNADLQLIYQAIMTRTYSTSGGTTSVQDNSTDSLNKRLLRAVNALEALALSTGTDQRPLLNSIANNMSGTYNETYYTHVNTNSIVISSDSTKKALYYKVDDGINHSNGYFLERIKFQSGAQTNYLLDIDNVINRLLGAFSNGAGLVAKSLTATTVTGLEDAVNTWIGSNPSYFVKSISYATTATAHNALILYK